MTCTSITLGGITFGECGEVDVEGINWAWLRIDGWESAGVEGDVLSPAGQDGDFFGLTRRTGRPIVLEGVAHRPAFSPNDVEGYWLAHNNLLAATNLTSGSGTLVVNEPIPKQATVRLQDRPRLRALRGVLGVLEFQIPLLAADWRKYSTTLDTDSSSPVNNGGFVRSTPIIVITGASTNPRITNTTDDTKYVQVNTTLSGGQTLTLDMESRTAQHSSLGNVDALITAGSRWWDLLPGDNVISLTGGGTWQAQYRDAYL